MSLNGSPKDILNYSYIGLSIPGQPVGDSGNALGITDTGLVLVNALSPSLPPPDNVDVNGVYDYRTGVFTALPEAPGAVPGSTLDNGINNSGEIVGQYDAGGGDLQAFVLQHGVFTTLAPFGLPYSFATSVSDNGLVTGVAVSPADGFGEGFVLDHGVYLAIQAGSTPTSNWITAPQSINDAGTVVGFDGPPGDVTNGFIDQRGVVSAFTLPDWAISQPVGINNRGDIVGVVTNDFANVFGFLDHHGAVSILQFPGSSQTFAEYINDQGVIDGQYLAPDGSYEAFLAFPTHGGADYSFVALPDTRAEAHLGGLGAHLDLFGLG
jgi:uncharacterized membrane protein